MVKRIIFHRSFKQKKTYVIVAVCAFAVTSTALFSHSLTAPLTNSKKAILQSSVHRGESSTVPSLPVDSVKPVSPAQWMGKKFILLAKPKMFQSFGYELYLTKNLSAANTGIDSTIETKNHHVRYNRFCNKIISVTAVEPLAQEFLITFTVDNYGHKLFAKTHKQAIEGIADLGDLDKAAKQWVGKTVYARGRLINTYDSASGSFGTVKISIQQPLKVNSVSWGTTPLPPKPVWLCVSTPGSDPVSGILPVYESWTNVMADKVKTENAWEEDVFEKNPSQLYPAWDSLTWKAINAHTIVSGMSKEQVRISWGTPHHVTMDTIKAHCKEQWIFGNQFLCFENDTVAMIGAK
jgi:hypothetical protein